MNYYPRFPSETRGESSPVKVVFERLHPDVRIPTKATPGAAGFDLYATHCRHVDGLIYQLSTGLKVKIPEGFEGQIRLRSSLGKQGFLIPNAPGTIDSDYRGEIQILIWVSDPDEAYLLRGKRVAQMVIARVPEVVMVEGVVACDTTRGAGGFGSTGK